MKKILKNIAFLALIFILGYTGKIHGQNCIVKGFIYDAGTRQPLGMVNVLVEPGGKGSLTSEDGFFIISGLPEGEVTLTAFCIGYDTVAKEVSLKKNETVVQNMTLARSAYHLNEVKISGKRDKIEQLTISEISMKPAEITLTPSIGGMADIIQHIQTVPGVVTRGDIGGQVYIRGGTPVQTKVLLDEAVIYNPVHSIGLFSVFDNDYLRNVDFYTGGFNAEFGGCLSSVIDISTKKPNAVNWSGKIDLSTIASKLLIEGPVLHDSTLEKVSLSFLLSVKSSHIDRASGWFYSYLDQELPFYFQDIYGKATLQMGNNSSVSISGFNFRDKVSESNTFKTYAWNSSGFSVNLLIMPPAVPILIKTYVAGSVYRMSLDEPNFDSRFSQVGSLSAGMKFYRYLHNQEIKYGIDFTDLSTSYRYFTNSYNKFEQGEHSNELSGFIDYQGKFGRWLLEGGLRAAYYATLNKISPEPRLAARYLITDNLAVKAAAGLYSQNLVGAASDKDIVNFFQGYLSSPVDMVKIPGQGQDNFSLQKASHLVAGLEYDFRGKVFLDLEAYYKNYTNLISFNKNKIFNKEDFPDAPSYLTGTFVSETGFAEGIEFSAKYEAGNLMMEVNYSLAMVKRRYTNPEGEIVEYFPQYDRRHNLNLLGMYVFGKNRSWMITARWNYGSGFPFTPTAGYYEANFFDENGNWNYLDQNGQMNIYYGSYNSKRLPAYHRLDFAVKKTIVIGLRSVVEAEFSLINVYDRQNIFYINRNTNEEAYQLPVLPSLRISYSF